MINKIKHWWKVKTGEEPPYNKWISHQEWHNRGWRELPGLHITDFDHNTNRIKVAPQKEI